MYEFINKLTFWESISLAIGGSFIAILLGNLFTSPASTIIILLSVIVICLAQKFNANKQSARKALTMLVSAFIITPAYSLLHWYVPFGYEELIKQVSAVVINIVFLFVIGYGLYVIFFSKKSKA